MESQESQIHPDEKVEDELLQKAELVKLIGNHGNFIRLGSKLTLRQYQVRVAETLIDAVVYKRGLSLVVMFPRQSGKNELQAQIEAYLLFLLHQSGAEMVKVSPTWKPQSINAMRRLERVLRQNPLTRHLWIKENGYIYRVGEARLVFLSGAPEANIVGATANTLLEVDEAQDVLPAKFDRDVLPMAASTNATRVFWGTAWTSQTLLGRELRAARQLEASDGRQRTFVLTADEVAREVPAYGVFVAGQVARLGRNHPLVRTQFFSEEIDAAGGLFNEARLALMNGQHPRQEFPQPGQTMALLLDVAGADETAGGEEAESTPGGRRDSTALTVVAVDLNTLADPGLAAPTYRVVQRRLWTGRPHSSLYGELRALADTWQARWLVIDATGVGAGLASFLTRALPGRVLPFVFNPASKSRLGWGFMAIIDAGRWKEPAPDPGDPLQALFLRQCRACEFEVLDGPARAMRWGVPEHKRCPESGGYLHDDLLLSAALCAALEDVPWGARSETLVVRGRDPLKVKNRF